MNASGGPGDPAGTAVAVVGAQGTVTAWSEGARLLLGYASAEAVGRPVAEVFAPAVLVLDREWQSTVAVHHRDGRLLDLEVRVSPALDGDGEPSGCVVTAVPEASDDALVRWAFEQSPASMSLYDSDLRHRRLNGTALEAMGDVPEGTLRGTPYQAIVPEEETGHGYGDHLRQVAETGRATHYEWSARDPVSMRDYAWNTDMWPIRDPRGRVRGVAVAAFDSTAQFWARQRLVLLNEAGAAIGTTLDVVRTADELAELAVPRLADFVSVDLLDSVLQGDEPSPGPVDSAVVLRRVAHRSRTDEAPVGAVELGEVDTYPEFSPPARCLAVLSQAGNVDFSLWVAQNALRDAKVRQYGLHTVMAVPLMARGVTLGVAIFARGTRPEGFIDDDMTLAEELAGRAAVCVDNARRFTREHGTALALQRSLLPQRLGDQPAVEVASRYLPAGSQAGVGGDWFDVVPLSGTRVALVVGDVVGHGIHASATMGRLRTAVRTLADVDLPPDELLTHLDDLVVHLNSGDETPEDSGRSTSTEVGATCLYAVYDPISRRCSMASAGHPSPVLRLPDGTVEVLPVSAGPPLGVGGLPFEATERELPEGSILALYTDGLIDSRDFDLDAGLARLRTALAAPAPSIESACDTILKSLPPDRPVDDVALLLARTRALNTAQVAVWDVPFDPAHVAETRQATAELLRAWGMEDAVHVTELVVSELVTNAIRHGSPPVQLRVIRDRSLICEVSDGSNTAPHLRRARSDDEGGRGLLLVAQLTQAWGTRQAATGKTIWAEQAL
ncbi:SpoIIE family protein phosphatase [Streptomyces sp. NPDC046977]|uniref:SpoIIE family protein phosphatase n=1 Tax=Streptomyces sp. NPDC046977 TaxID=3154703 RepID=UPI0033CF11ED